MAMNGDTLATEIIAAMNTLSSADKRIQLKVMKKMTNAIIDHITVNGVIATTVASGIACSVDPGTHIGSTTATGAGTGNIS